LVEPSHRLIASGLQAAAGTVVVNAQVDGTAFELYAVRDATLWRLTRDGAGWQGRFALPDLEEVELPGPAGPIQAWIYGPGTVAKPPVIIDIHGGPTGAWGPGTSLDLLALTDAGYRVVRPNIRGSAGFGAAWADGLGPRWGETDAADLPV